MHEASLARTLIRQVRDIAAAQDDARVAEVSVSVGEFSGVEPDLLQLAFDQQIAATPLSGTRLRLQRVPLEGACSQCEHVFEITKFRFVCPSCEATRIDIVRGEEMILESVLFEEVQAAAAPVKTASH